MEGLKVQALVTGGVDYKESDKLITLCSVERGKFTALLKGCRKQKSKNRFCGAPFCFAEYVLTEKNGFYVVTGATAIDQFINISADIDRFYAGNVILETLNKIAKEGENIAPLIVVALNHIKSLCYENVNEGLVLLSFFLTVFKQSGYMLTFEECKVCRCKSFNRKYFSATSGGVVCNICAGCPVLTNKSHIFRFFIFRPPLFRLSKKQNFIPKFPFCRSLIEKEFFRYLANLL